MKKIFTVTSNVSGGRSYKVTADCWCDFDIIWRSEMCWFPDGANIIITDESGQSKTYIK